MLLLGCGTVGLLAEGTALFVGMLVLVVEQLVHHAGLVVLF